MGHRNNQRREAPSGDVIRTTLGDLIEIFEEEAEKVCFTEHEAKILALEALSDFVTARSRNFLIG